MPPQANTLKNTSSVLEICILSFDTGDNKIFKFRHRLFVRDIFFISKPTSTFLSPWFGATERGNVELREDNSLAIRCNLSMYHGRID